MSTLLDRRIYRQLGQADMGPVYTFDIDKTYLDTTMSHAKDLLRIPLELAIDKRPYAGIPELLRACQHGSDKSGGDRPVFFVSASPKQMRAVLERRMELDELTVDGLTLKSWGYYLRRARFSGLTNQVGYKLLALLATRAELPAGAQEILFGDDSEADAFIYSLYSAIITGKLAAATLERELTQSEVPKREKNAILDEVAASAPTFASPDATPVRHVFIHAVRERRDLRVQPLGVAPIVYSTPLYPGALLYRAGFIRGDGLSEIYRALRAKNAFVAAEARDHVAPILAETGADWQERLFGGAFGTP